MSPELQVSEWDKKRPRTENGMQIQKQSFGLNMPLMPLGGPAKVGSNVYILSDTCNIDCTLQIIFYLNEYTTKGKQYFSSKSGPLAANIQEVITMMRNYRMQGARVFWIQRVLGKAIQKSQSMLGEERNNGVGGLKIWLNYIRKQTVCRDTCCPSSVREERVSNPVDEYPLHPEMFLAWFRDGREISCDVCHSGGAIMKYSFDSEPPLLLIYICNSRWQTKQGTTIHAHESDLKRNQVVGGYDHTVQAYSMYTGDHFYVVFWTNDGRFTYDGKLSPLKISSRTVLSKDHAVHSLWLLRN